MLDCCNGWSAARGMCNAGSSSKRSMRSSRSAGSLWRSYHFIEAMLIVIGFEYKSWVLDDCWDVMSHAFMPRYSRTGDRLYRASQSYGGSI
jgi:hypothetical protein